jgi:hypothetical protein
MAIMLSTEEQETLVSMSRNSNVAVVYASDVRMRNRLKKLYPDKLKRTFSQAGEIVAEEYEIDRRMISFRSKLPEAHPLTEEQRKARSERMKAFRAKQLAEKKEG